MRSSCASTTPIPRARCPEVNRPSSRTSAGSGSAGTRARSARASAPTIYAAAGERAEATGGATRDADGSLRLDGVTLLRADGSATYQLATVADDLDLGITHVIRGSDHRPNEAPQRRIARAIGGELPEVVHHGLLLGEDGKKLSKRHGHASVADLRDDGIPAAALRTYLEELGLPAHDVRLDRARIGRLAIEAIAAMSDAELVASADAPVETAQALRGARTLVEAREIARQLVAPRPAAVPPDAAPTLERFVELRAGQPAALDEPAARAIVRELKAVGGDLRSLRLALTGEPRGPELWAVLAALPVDEALARVRRAQSRCLAEAGHRDASLATSAAAGCLRSPHAPAGHADGEARRASAASRADRDLRLRADRLPAGAHRQRAAVRRLHVARPMAQDARSRGPARPQHHGRQRQDLRGGARAQRRAGARGDAVVPRGHRGLRARDAGLAAARDRDDAGDRRPDRGAARLGARVHGGRRRLLPRRRASRATAPCRVSVPTRSRSRSPTRPRRTRATSPSGRRRRRARTPRGRPPGGSAAPAGTSNARRWPRRSSARSSGSTAGGSTSSSRITRTSARNRCPSGIRSRGSGCTTGCCASPARRCRSRSGTWRRSATCSTPGARRRRSCSSSRRTGASRSTSRRRRWRRRGLRRRRSRNCVFDGEPAARGAILLGGVRGGARGRLQYARGPRGPPRWARSRDARPSFDQRARRVRAPRPARLHKIHLTDHVTVAGDVSVDVVEGHRPDTREILDGRPGLVELFRRRRAARRQRDFGASDELRERLRSAGAEVEDTAEGGRLVIRDSE